MPACRSRACRPLPRGLPSFPCRWGFSPSAHLNSLIEEPSPSGRGQGEGGVIVGASPHPRPLSQRARGVPPGEGRVRAPPEHATHGSEYREPKQNRRGPQDMTRARLIGSRVRRVEDPRLITGAATYIGDLAPIGVLHVAFVRSPHAHARITGIDLSAARTT